MTNDSHMLSSEQSVTNSRGVSMRRRMLTLAVALVSLSAGACAGRIQVAGLPPGDTIVVSKSVPETSAEPDILQVRVLAMADIMVPLSYKTAEQTVPSCDPLEQIHKAEELLKPVELSVGTKPYRYSERRAGGLVSFTDPEKQIALELLDEKNCTLSQVVITKQGDKLIAPAGYDIEAVTRVNGIRWNNWATEYAVTTPHGLTVIANKYPLVQGAKVTMVYYTPYSKELHVPELVDGGRGYLTDLAKSAYEELKQQQVPSMTGNHTLVAEVPSLKPEFVARLVPNELMDMTEFLLDPTWTTERIHVVIGANRDRVATYTCSKARACGIMQFTGGTYALMAKMYPQAKLNPDFVAGARDPLNAMKAAVLLHDYNLSALIGRFGSSVAADPKLEEYLAAAYNTGVGRVEAVLAVAFKAKAADWAETKGKGANEHLLGETKGYIAKLRYLRDQWPMPPLAKVDILTPDR